MEATTVTAIADLVQRSQALISGLDGRMHALVPNGMTLKEILPADWDPKLIRIKAAAVMHDQASFVSYANRYKSDATRMFAEPGFINGGRPTIAAIFDYHEKDEPHHAAHVASYSPRYSEQWLRWQKNCSATLRQVEFAEMIEECRTDILEPAAAALLDIVRAFKATKKTEFDSVTYQQNGDTLLHYSEKTEQQGGMKMPETLKLCIPVFFRGPRYEVPVFIRYRVGNGGIAFNLKLDRPDRIEDDAFQQITAGIAEGTAIEVYMGKP